VRAAQPVPGSRTADCEPELCGVCVDARSEFGFALLAVGCVISIILLPGHPAHFVGGLLEQRARLRGIPFFHLGARHLIEPAHTHRRVCGADIGYARDELRAHCPEQVGPAFRARAGGIPGRIVIRDRLRRDLDAEILFHSFRDRVRLREAGEPPHDLGFLGAGELRCGVCRGFHFRRDAGCTRELRGRAGLRKRKKPAAVATGVTEFQR